MCLECNQEATLYAYASPEEPLHIPIFLVLATKVLPAKVINMHFTLRGLGFKEHKAGLIELSEGSAIENVSFCLCLAIIHQIQAGMPSVLGHLADIAIFLLDLDNLRAAQKRVVHMYCWCIWQPSI